MPKPKTKKELIEQSQVSYQKLLELVNSYPKEIVEKEFPKGTLNRNIKDVLSHLHHWHLMMIGWYTVGMKGEQPAMPAKGYTWQTLPALNQKIWEDCQDIKLERAKELLAESFQKAQHIMKLFKKSE